MSVKIGDTFRASYADSMPTFRVTKKAGPGVYLAIIEDDMDYSGVEKAFTTQEIESSKQWAARFAKLAEADDDFWATVSEGDILHYNDGFGNFVRCEVVMGTEDNAGGVDRSENVGRLVMLPVALVGNWKQFDLANRRPDGSISYGYHARKVIEGNGAWRASTTCIYEAPDYSRGYAKHPDPRTLPALSLEVPEMTELEEQAALEEQMRQAMIEALNDHTVDAATAIMNALAQAGIVD